MSFLLLAALVAFSPARSTAADAEPARRNRTTPGLVLNTGGRHAACDALTFTADGRTLLAAGDDKVVRAWPVDLEGGRLDPDRAEVLRWPIYRDQKGSIYTLGLSPDPDNRRLVIAGFGALPPSMVAILSRKDGAITHVLDQQEYKNVVWQAVFDPKDEHVVFGTEHGSLWRWDFNAGKNKVRHFGPAVASRSNPVRLIAFTDDDHFLSVASDGDVLLWDLRSPAQDPDSLGRFQLGKEGLSLFRVVMSRDGKWLAAVGEQREGAAAGGNFRRVELFSLARKESRLIPVPGKDTAPHCLAFDSEGNRLAVGLRVGHERDGFLKWTGGKVVVYDLQAENWKDGELPVTYRPEALAFHPTRAGWLATAGGDNHEVVLWNWERRKVLTEVRGAGSCLWGVGLSADGCYLGFQEKRAKDPPGPNEWGAGDWRVFDLKERNLLPAAPKDFQPVRPLETLAGWSVETKRPYEWAVLSPRGDRFPLSKESGLYDPALFSLPRCYTFLPAAAGKPSRLALGHYWGVSLYELPDAGPRLVRLMIGHEGEVMALGPSADGKTLVTAGRDQTVSGWSLEDWKSPVPGKPVHPELGAWFIESDDKLIVRRVVPGSPAWEAGLAEDDEVVLLAAVDSDFLYNPYTEDREVQDHPRTREVLALGMKEGNLQGAVKELRNARPGRELFFLWRPGGKGRLRAQLTTVRQRPLWKFFPARRERDNAWILWRWRDYYYDTNSAAADVSFVGWHVNGEKPDDRPEFLPLRSQEERLHKPGKVQEALDGFVKDPDKVLFADLEPPVVRLTAAETRLRGQDLELRLTVRPNSAAPGQAIDRVSLWVNDYRFPLAEPGDGDWKDWKVTVGAADLRVGENQITLIAYNKDGGRAEYPLHVECKPAVAAGPRPRLYGLCVGVEDYAGLRGYEAPGGGSPDLPGAVADARAVYRLLRDEEGLFPRAERGDVKLLTDQAVTAAAVVEELERMSARVAARDTLVLFLAGHGIAEKGKGAKAHDPATWFFACSDTDRKKEGTKLYGRQLHEALARIKGRKVVFLDTCHSGAVAANPIRALGGEGPPPLVFSACQLEERAAGTREHGIFTACLLDALHASEGRHADRNDDRRIDALELADYLRREVYRRSGALAAGAAQHPVIFPDKPDPVPLFSRR